MAFENEVGAQPPLGFWDPLGLLAEADQDRFDRLRFVEVKHGRVAMLACLGHFATTAGARLPGTIDLDGTTFDSIPNGLAGLAAVPAFGLFQLFISIGIWELLVWKQVEGSTPGDFGIPYLGNFKTAEQQEDIRAKELNQGRAAQMGILALMVHEQLNNDPYVINSLIGAPIAFNAGF
jgi:hypothetical protein